VQYVALSVSQNTLRIIQSGGILVGILVGATSMWIGIRSIRAADRAARVTTLLTLTSSHREVWRSFAARPELQHALDWNARQDEMTEDEQQWLRELILHISASFEAERLGVLPKLEGLDADIRQLLSKPLPHAVWRQMRPYQNRAFVEYVDAQLREAEKRHGGEPFGLAQAPGS
jgi:hypothetical protein